MEQNLAQPSPLGLEGESHDASQAGPQPFGDLLIGLFSEPSSVFRSLRRWPSWLLPVVALTAATALAAAVWLYRMDPAARIQHSFDAMSSMIGTALPDAELQAALNAAKKPILQTLAWVAIGPWISGLLVGLVIWGFARMGSVMDKEPASFKHAFSVAAVHNLATLPSCLAMALTMLAKPVGGLSEVAMNPFSLGYFVHPQSIWTKGLFTAVLDPFYLFSFFLLALGMRHTLRAKPWATVAAVGLILIVAVPVRLLYGAL